MLDQLDQSTPTVEFRNLKEANYGLKVKAVRVAFFTHSTQSPLEEYFKALI